GCIAFSPNGFAQSSQCLAHIAKTPSWAGATPLRCSRIRCGRSSPKDIHHHGAHRRTMHGFIESRMTACMAGPQEGEKRNASSETTTKANPQCDDSGSC